MFVALLVSLWFGARFADGPIEIFPGGPFTSGREVAFSEVDWASLAHHREMEFQLVTPPRSRTAWFTVYEGAAYIHCSFCTNRILKRWPRELEHDDRIVVRIDGLRIPGRAVRVTSRAEYLAVTEVSRVKYGAAGARASAEREAAAAVVAAGRAFPGAPAGEDDHRWLFRVEAR